MCFKLSLIVTYIPFVGTSSFNTKFLNIGSKGGYSSWRISSFTIPGNNSPVSDTKTYGGGVLPDNLCELI